MWIQVSPFASVLDAESVLPRIQENNFRRNPRAEVTVVEERKIEDQEIAGIANPWRTPWLEPSVFVKGVPLR